MRSALGYAGLLALLVWSAVVGAAAQKPPDVGCENLCVAGITGHWVEIAQLELNKKPTYLKFTDSIKNKCVAGDGGSLVVSISGTLTSFACDRTDAGCARPVNYSCAREIVAPAKPSALSALRAAIADAFAQPNHYQAAMSRGLEPHLWDAVLEKEADQVDFAPALSDMSPGIYRLRLEPMDGGAAIDFTLEWTEKHQGKTMVAGIRPGLFRMWRLTSEAEPAEPETWVLVDGPERFRNDAAAFQSAKDEVAKWPPDVDPRAPGSVLRAYLESLSRKQGMSR